MQASSGIERSPAEGERPVDGSAELAVAMEAGAPRLALLYHKTPLRVLMPRPAVGDPTTAVIANVSGGVVGGDRLSVSVEAQAGAAALVTSQAAEKVYRSAGADASIETRLAVGPGAWLEWMPQEAILFDRARLRRSLAIDLAPGARLLAAESVVFGRIARGESFGQGLLQESWRVARAGRLVWADSLRLEDDIPQRLASRAGFGGALAASTIVYAGEDAADRVALARGLLEDGSGVRGGATCVGGLMIARLLADSPQALRLALLGFWAGFRHEIAGLPARAPRLWAV